MKAKTITFCDVHGLCETPQPYIVVGSGPSRAEICKTCADAVGNWENVEEERE